MAQFDLAAGARETLAQFGRSRDQAAHQEFDALG
jgi:hypothetical protein